jgi:hypothetical protein
MVIKRQLFQKTPIYLRHVKLIHPIAKVAVRKLVEKGQGFVACQTPGSVSEILIGSGGKAIIKLMIHDTGHADLHASLGQFHCQPWG